MAQAREKIEEFGRQLATPMKIIGIVAGSLITVFRDEIRNWTENRVTAIAISFFKARTETAMEIANFIRLQWWLIPWCGVPLTIILIFWEARRDAAKEIAARFVPLKILNERDLRNSVKQWLSARLGASKDVSRAFLFGSVMHDDYPTRDVDLVVLFKPMSLSTFGRKGRNLRRKLSEDFERRFQHPLHLQFFLASEVAKLDAFVKQADDIEQLEFSLQGSH